MNAAAALGAGPVARLDGLRDAMSARGLDGLLVTHPANARYLFGIEREPCVGLVQDAGSVLVVAAGWRRRTRFDSEHFAVRVLPPAADGTPPFQALLHALPDVVDGRWEALGFDDEHLSVAALRTLENRLRGRARLVAAAGLVEALRAVKDDRELAAVRAAAALGDAIISTIAERGLVGRREREVAAEIHHRARTDGEGVSFAPIVAAGAHAARPHAAPTDAVIGRNQVVILDCGVVLDGYCSDCTRVLVTGPPSAVVAEAFAAVRVAQERVVAALAPGAVGRELDTLARQALVDAGYGDAFGHGLGHGVGVEVHEAPTLNRVSDEIVEEDAIVTVEPGVYLPGRFGLRLEDLFHVTADGPIRLGALPRELIEVS
jgi:Xaa-Pro aminopeptidase